MSRKGKIDAEEKIRIIQEYIEGKISQGEAAKRAEVTRAAVQEWEGIFQAEGSLGLLDQKINRKYSAETKESAVKDYLSGKGSIRKMCKKYAIRSTSILRSWIKVYNSGKNFNKHQMSGGSRMKKTRKTTQEERIAIAKDCIANGNNYGETALKYQVSYQQVYTWVKKFSELGEAGLEDRRGQRTAQQEPRTEEEELRVKIAQLEHELYMTRMERDLLKKLEEVERRDAYRK